MAWVTPTNVATGDVLTAATWNQAVVENTKTLALRFIKSQTIGSGVSDVTVTGAFSADYDAYRVIITNMDTSAAADLFIRFGTSTTRTEYRYSAVTARQSDGATVTAASSTGTNAGLFLGYTTTNETNWEMDVVAPFLAQPTTAHALWSTDGNGGFACGWDGLESSHTQFVLRPSSGTLTGGEIRVYGYINS